MTLWLITLAFLIVGVLMVLSGRGMRQKRGLADARTLYLDRRNLFSYRLGLTGCPDRVVDERGVPIPVEWKSSRRLYDAHRAQMAVYSIFIEEETGFWPPHGFISLVSGEWVKVENTDDLRAWVFGLVDQIRRLGGSWIGRFR